MTARRTNSMNTGEGSLASGGASPRTVPSTPQAKCAGSESTFLAARLDTVPDVASFVREQRMREGLTLMQLAERTGLSESSLAKFERGEAPSYPLGHALRLLRALGVRLEAAPARTSPDLAAVLGEVNAGKNTGPNSR